MRSLCANLPIRRPPFRADLQIDSAGARAHAPVVIIPLPTTGADHVDACWCAYELLYHNRCPVGQVGFGGGEFGAAARGLFGRLRGCVLAGDVWLAEVRCTSGRY